MKKFWFLAAALCVAVVPARVEAQFFADNFDTYATGSMIGGQGGWETWDLNPAANTTVTDLQAFTVPNSLLIAGPADIVHQFVGVDTGTWHAKVVTYVPSTQTGEMFFILLNTYAPGGPYNWSAQVVLCVTGCSTAGAIPGQVVNLGGSEVGGGGQTPLLTNQWVELRVSINFTTNQYQVFYNGVLFDTQAWTAGAPIRLQAIDLFSNGSSQSFMDNAWLDTTVPVELINFTVS